MSGDPVSDELAQEAIGRACVRGPVSRMVDRIDGAVQSRLELRLILAEIVQQARQARQIAQTERPRETFGQTRGQGEVVSQGLPASLVRPRCVSKESRSNMRHPALLLN